MKTWKIQIQKESKNFKTKKFWVSK